MNKKQEPWLLFIKSFGFLFPILLIISFALLYLVTKLFRNVYFGSGGPIWVIPGFRGRDLYEILETPFPYLSTISLISSIVGAFWSSFVIPKFSRYLLLQILIVPWIAVLLTGPLWGLIWSVNQWPAGYFSNVDVLMLYRRTDIQTGFELSWLSALQSFPINIFSYLTYCGLLLVNKKIFSPTKKEFAVPDSNPLCRVVKLKDSNGRKNCGSKK